MKMDMKTHVLWMFFGFVVLLIVSKIVGVSAFLLFFFLCFFMMALMMMGMGHGGQGKGGGSHEH